MPAFLAGALLSWLVDYLRPGLPEWVSALAVLLLIPLLWYWIGSWVDKNVNSGKNRNGERGRWIMLLFFFMLLCATASSIPEYVGGYTGYVVFGTAIWLIAAIGVKATPALRTRKQTHLTPG